MNWVSKNYFTSPNQLKCQPKLQENLFTHFFGLIKIFVNFSQIVKRQYRCPTRNFYNDFLKSLICLKKNASTLKYHRVRFAFSHRVHNAKEFFSLWFAKNDDMCCNPTLAMVRWLQNMKLYFLGFYKPIIFHPTQHEFHSQGRSQGSHQGPCRRHIQDTIKRNRKQLSFLGKEKFLEVIKLSRLLFGWSLKHLLTQLTE